MPDLISLKSCLECLEAHLAAENNHDLDAIMATYASDPLVDINGQVFSGADKVRFFHERFGFGGNGSFSDVTVNEKQRFISEGVITIEQELSGKHTGRWKSIEATGKTFKMPVCTLYFFSNDGKLKAEHVYFDSAILLKQLGIVVP